MCAGYFRQEEKAVPSCWRPESMSSVSRATIMPDIRNESLRRAHPLGRIPKHLVPNMVDTLAASQTSASSETPNPQERRVPRSPTEQSTTSSISTSALPTALRSTGFLGHHRSDALRRCSRHHGQSPRGAQTVVALP